MMLVAGAAAADVPNPIPGNPLIAVAGGSFIFGRDDGNENERPQRVVSLPGFEMNRTEVTNAQYRRFIAASGHRPAFFAAHPALGRDDYPVVGISWSDASDFCAYHGLALPSERQFERTARGSQGKPYPWGDALPDKTRVSRGSEACCHGDNSDGFPMTAPVGSFPQGESQEGIVDLIGNVWEWTRDWYAPYEGEPDPAMAHRFRVLRGGAWNSDTRHLSATYRLAYDPSFHFAANGGFRCVRASE